MIRIVDGSSFIHRAFFAYPPIISPAGEPCGAIVGVYGMLRRLKADVRVFVVDGDGQKFRQRIYPNYKANRPPKPLALVSQIIPILSMARALGYCVIRLPGVEADDVIASIVNHHEDDIIIHTGDKDLAQLVSVRVSLDVGKEQILGPDEVLKRYGVRPDQIADWLALAGDVADNIPGVPGWGPTIAAEWLSKYPTMGDVIDAAMLLAHRSKRAKSLIDHVADVMLYRRLTAVIAGMEIAVKPWPYNELAIHTMAERYGFRSRARPD